MEQNKDRRRRIDELLDQIGRSVDAGEVVFEPKVVREHPELMPELGEELRALLRVKKARQRAERGGPPAAPADAPGAEAGEGAREARTEASDARAERGAEPGSVNATLGGLGAGRTSFAIAGYDIIREISRGGQGVVYQAMQKSTGRKVALKMLPGGPFVAPRDLARFEREAQVLAALDHPNIVAVLDKGVTPDGSYYIVMDYISGRPLDEFIRAYRASHPDGVGEPGAALVAVTAVTCSLATWQVARWAAARPAAATSAAAEGGGVPANEARESRLAAAPAGAVGHAAPAPIEATPAAAATPAEAATGLAQVAVAEPPQGDPPQEAAIPQAPPEDAAGEPAQQVALASATPAPAMVVPDPLPARPAAPVAPSAAAVAPGESLSRLALAQAPAARPGLRSWAPETVAPRGGTYALAYRPDGALLASAGQDGAIRLWDTPAGTFRAALLGHDATVHALAWSRDGRYLASASWDKTVRVWEPETGTLLHTLRGHAGPVADVAWSPDGQRLVSGSRDGTLRIWDATNGREVRTIELPTPSVVRAVAWSPDGTRLASCSAGDPEPGVRIWNAETGEMLAKGIGENLHEAFDVAWSLSGKYLLAHSYALQVFDGRAMTRLHVRELDAMAPMSYPAWLADDRLAYYHERALRTLDPARGADVSSVPFQPRFWNSMRAAAWSTDGTQMASAQFQDLVLHDSATGETRVTVAGQPAIRGDARTTLAGATVTWSPRGDALATVSEDRVRLWQVDSSGAASLARAIEIDMPGGITDETRVAWSPDGSQIAVLILDRVQLYEAESGEMVQLWRLPTTAQAGAWTPDGERFTAATHEVVCFFDRRSEEPFRVLRDLQLRYVSLLAWSPDGKTLAIGSSGQAPLRLWSEERVLTAPPTLQHIVTSLCWSADSQRIWGLGTYDLGRVTTVFGWAPASEPEPRVLAAYDKEKRVFLADLVHDGEALVAIGDDGVLRRLDPETGEELATLEGLHIGALHPGGRVLAASGASRLLGTSSTVLLYDTHAGKHLRSLVNLAGGRGLIVNPDGSTDSAVEEEGPLVYVVQPEPGDDTRGAVQRTLTREEFETPGSGSEGEQPPVR